MEKGISSNLEEKISLYLSKLAQSNSLTGADMYELESHFLEQIDELKQLGLDDEEAFFVASKRLSRSDFEDDFGNVNDNVIQLRKTTTILAGVLMYFFLYYFVLFTSKSFLLILELYEDNTSLNIQRMKTFLIAIHFIIILISAMIYFYDKWVINGISKLNIRPKFVLCLLIATFILAVVDRIYLPIIKRALGDNFSIRNPYFFAFDYFSYSFPLLICICFMVLYFKYFKIKQE